MADVIHLCPLNTLFNRKVERIAKQDHAEYFFYETDFKFFSLKELAALYAFVKGHSKHHIVFHRAPSFSIWVLNFLFPNMLYTLYFWGDDYYIPILPVYKLTRHCVTKSKFQKFICSEKEREEIIREAEEYQLKDWDTLKKSLVQAAMRLIAISAARHAQCIYSSQKQYRYLRLLSNKIYKSKVFPEYLLMSRYSEPEDDNTPKIVLARHELLSALDKNEITVLVCHSAAPTDNVIHTLSLLEYFSKKTGILFNVVGYLSYSGGNEKDRNLIEMVYRERAECFAKTVKFERRFLSEDELRRSFDLIDMAFFSAYRDEGVTLLSMLSQAGKVLCFNKRSMNYDYFRHYPGLISHEEFLEGGWLRSSVSRI